MIENLNEAIFSLDGRGRITYISSVIKKISGYKPGEVVGTLFHRYIYPEDRPGVMENFQRALSGRKVTCAFRVLDKRGRIHHMVASARILKEKKKVTGVIGILEDVTEQVAAEDALQDSAGVLNHFFDIAGDLLCIADTDGYFHLLNAAWESVLGFPRAELMSKKFMDFVHPDDVKATLEAVARLVDQKEVHSFINRYRCKDGTYRSLEWHTIPAGRMIYAAARDITERRRAEDALRESEWQYRSTLDSMSDAIHLVDRNFRVLLMNRAFIDWCRTLGLEMDAAGKDLFDVFPFLADKVKREYRKVFRTGEVLVTEEVSNIAGREIVTETRKIPIFEGGKVVRVVTSVRDITERKKAEIAIQESEERYRCLFDLSPDAIVVHDGKRILLANVAAMALLGIREPGEIIGRPILDFVHPDYRKLVIERARAQIAEGRAVPAAEEKFVRPDGSVIDVEVTAAPIHFQNAPASLVIFRDVTERRKAAAALKESEEKYRGVVERANDGILIIQDGIVKYANPRLLQMGGWSFEEVVGSPLTAYIHPDELHKLMDRYNRRVAGEDFPSTYETVLLRKDKSSVRAELNAGLIQYEGRNSDLVIVHNISERKEAERALREAEAKYRALVEQIPAAVYTDAIDELSTTQYISPPIEAMTGYSPAEFVADPGLWLRIIHPDDVPAVRMKNQRTNETGEQFNMQYRFVRRDGAIVWVRDQAELIRDLEGTPLYWQGVIMDITGQKIVEAALRESEEKFRSIIEQATDGFMLADEDGMIIEWNNAQEQIMGLARAKAIGQSFWELQNCFTVPERQSLERTEHSKSLILAALKTGQSPIFNRPIEVVISRADGMARVIEQTSFPIKAERGYRMGAFTRDVTRRKEAEAAITDSETSYRGLFNSVSDAIYIQDRQGRFLDVNDGAARMYGYPPEYFVGKTPADISAPGRNDPEKLGVQLESAFRGEPQRFEFWGVRSNGEIFPKDVRLTKGTYFGQEVVIAMAQDITARKQAENALQRRLQEMTILHATAQTSAQAATVDDLIEGITNVFVENLHYDYFGMLLLDAKAGVLITHPSLHGVFKNGRPGPIPLGQGVTGTVAATGLPRRVSDTNADPHYLDVSVGTRSELCVPIMIAGRVIGVINAESTQMNFFSEDDERLLMTIAGAMASSIERLRLFESEHTRRQEAETLRQATAAVSSSLELGKVLEAILDSLRKVLPYDSASVILSREDGDLEIVAARGLPEGHSFINKRFGQTEKWRRLVETQKPLILADTRLDPDFALWDGAEYIRGWMAVPLINRGTVIGYVTLDSRKTDAYTEEDSVLAQAFAYQAAMAVANARLYEEAVKAAERRVILHKASQEIALLSQDPEGVYEAVHRAARQLMPAEAFVIALVDETSQENVAVYMVDKGGRWPPDRIPAGEGLSGQVVSSESPLIVQDLATDANPIGIHFGAEEEVRSILAVPIRLGGKVIGMLSAQSYLPHAYSEEDRALLEMLAAHAAVAIENARLFEQTQRRRMEAEALRDVSLALNSSLDIDQVLHHLLDSLAQVVPFDSVTVFLHQGNSLRAVAGRGLPSNESAVGKLFPADDVLFQAILEARRPLVIADAQNDARFQRYGETDYVRGWMGIPMIVRGQVIGILTIDSRTPSAYTDNHVQMARAFANQAAAVIENARLFAETRRRLEELEILNRVSTELRMAQNVSDMLPMLLDEALQVLVSESGALWLFDQASGLLRKHAAKGWPAQVKEGPVKPGEGIAGTVFSTGKAILSREFASENLTRESVRRQAPAGWGGVCVPIRTGQESLGVMFISVQLPRILQPEEVDLLVTISEIAGNAIRRADLREQTERQLKRLATLRSIDMAISTILDLRVTLGILIDHIVTQLQVDAVNFLLLNSNTQTLYHAAGIGFQSDAFKNAQLFIGDSLASQAIRTRTTVYIPDLAQSPYADRLQGLSGEGFVAYFGVPLIAKGQVKGVLEVYQRSRMEPDSEWRGFLETLGGQAAIAIDNSLLFEELQQTNLNLSMAYDATIEGWSKALDMRDRETEGHTLRVTEMTLRLAEMMDATVSELVHIRRGALLHDIGKMGVPDSILFKPGELTDEEWVVMRRHPGLAYEMLSPIAYLRQAVEIPYCHHEHWDGSGYPRGLRGEQIPLSARLFAVVDVWDALTSDRPYRRAWARETTVEYIRQRSGKQFDPHVVDAFLKILGVEV